MGGLINFIKSIFSGIFGFIGGLFGSKKAIAGTESQPKAKKKNNGYFLELDDAKSDGTATVQAAAPAPAAVASVGKPEPQPANPAGSTRKEKLAAAAKASKSGEKSAAKKTSEKPAAAAAKAPTPVVAATKPSAPSDREFATKYLISPNNGGRRRPGASMTPYLTMARQMGGR